MITLEQAKKRNLYFITCFNPEVVYIAGNGCVHKQKVSGVGGGFVQWLTWITEESERIKKDPDRQAFVVFKMTEKTRYRYYALAVDQSWRDS